MTAEQRDFLETVKFSADALLNLISDILDFSKVEAGKIELEEKELGYASRQDFSRAVKQSKKSGVYPLPVLAPRHLFRGLFNLVGNALKFTE